MFLTSRHHSDEGAGAGQALSMVLAVLDADHLAWAPAPRKGISLEKRKSTAHFRSRSALDRNVSD